jgi:competence protein ComFC
VKVLLPWLKRAVDLIYPRNCRCSWQPLGETEPGVVCPVCLSKAKLIEPPFCQRCALPFDGKLTEAFTCGYCKDLAFHFSRAVAACRTEGIVFESIHRFKYIREKLSMEQWQAAPEFLTPCFGLLVAG